MQSKQGSATVPVAPFGVAPTLRSIPSSGKSGCPAPLRRTSRAARAPGECNRLVGGTPTRAVETTAHPIFQLHRSGQGDIICLSVRTGL